jgi:cation:H+ antiporter
MTLILLTSTPEMAVSVKATLANQTDIVTGSCIGSTSVNVLFILWACALLAPLVVAQQLIRLDVPIMIGVHGALPGCG